MKELRLVAVLLSLAWAGWWVSLAWRQAWARA
jgi:hypothetical protein